MTKLELEFNSPVLFILFIDWGDVCLERGLRSPYYFICALHLTQASLCPLLVLGFREESQATATLCVWATLYGTDKHLQNSRMASHTLENMTASECQHLPNVTIAYSDRWGERRWEEETGCVCKVPCIADPLAVVMTLSNFSFCKQYRYFDRKEHNKQHSPGIDQKEWKWIFWCRVCLNRLPRSSIDTFSSKD